MAAASSISPRRRRCWAVHSRWVLAALAVSLLAAPTLANVSAYADFDRRVAAAGLDRYVGHAAACAKEAAWICLTVSGSWHALPKGTRLEMLRALWKGWALTCTHYGMKRQADQCRLTLVSGTGRKLGGSSGWAGSSLSLED